MTPDETRQLGIEFERRVQTMIPQKEYVEKLDTQTIYSYLNQYQDKYIHEIYRNLDNIQSGSKLSLHIESILQSLLREKTVQAEESGKNKPLVDNNGITVSTGRSYTYKLPKNFYLYVRSVSQVSSTFSFKSNTTNDTDANIRVVPNEFVSQSEVWKLLETPHNSLRILRYPAAVLSPMRNEQPQLTVIYDQYTTPVAVNITYYAQPQKFDIMDGTVCELPIDAFEELVSGAVDLYVQYVAGAEANRKRQEEAARQEQRNRRKESDE